MSGPAVDGVWVVMGRLRAGHARPLQGGNFCNGRRPQRPAEGSRPLPTVLVEKQVPFGLLGGRGRACPAPTGRLWGIRTAMGRPVKAPLVVCGCRSPSSFRRGFGCLRHGGCLRLRGVRIQIRLIVRDGLVQLVDFCLRGIAGGEQVGVLAVGVQGGLGVLQFSLCFGQAGVGLVNGSLRIDELLRVRQRGLGGGSGFISDAACQQGGLSLRRRSGAGPGRSSRPRSR